MEALAVRRPDRLEVADIFRAYGDRVDGLSLDQQRAARAIIRCRTAALGGHLHRCDSCGHEEIAYNSCRNRHCPKCQGLDEARWVDARKAHLLPVEYFHVVFTVPEELHPLFRANSRVALDLLFATVSKTLQEVALNPQHLGAQIGFTSVLHTWTQKLLYHPHLHCIVPGGGLSPTGDQWISAKPGFLLPVRVLSKVFRGKLLSALERAHTQGILDAPSRTDPLVLLRRASRKDWVVYSKPPFSGPQQVIAYLGRYTHRIAISNDRLVSMRDGQVTFRWRDRSHENVKKLMTLEAAEFLRRFLLHVLPTGLVRLRHFGFLANSVREKRLAQCRALLAVPPETIPVEPPASETWQEMLLRLTGRDATACPRCQKGRLIKAGVISPVGVHGDLRGRATSA